MNILIIEDNIQIAENIALLLTYEKYSVEYILTGYEGVEKAHQNKYDIIILDIMLPDIDGITVCKILRKNGCKSAILMLTAKITIDDKVTGLDSGADDYLTKPFVSEELLARIRALSRRRENTTSQNFEVNGVQIDLSAKKITKGSKIISCSPLEFRIIEFLISNKGKACSPIDIYEAVWGNDDMLFSDVLKVHIARIRAKLGRDFIKTVSGFGYCIEY